MAQINSYEKVDYKTKSKSWYNVRHGNIVVNNETEKPKEVTTNTYKTNRIPNLECPFGEHLPENAHKKYYDSNPQTKNAWVDENSCSVNEQTK
jgi:hypothetical protein